MPPQLYKSPLPNFDKLNNPWSKQKMYEVRRIYLLRSSWIKDMSKPLLPRKYFDPNGAAGAG